MMGSVHHHIRDRGMLIRAMRIAPLCTRIPMEEKFPADSMSAQAQRHTQYMHQEEKIHGSIACHRETEREDSLAPKLWLTKVS